MTARRWNILSWNRAAVVHTRFRFDTHRTILVVQTSGLLLIAFIFIGGPAPEQRLMYCAINIVLLVNYRLVLLFHTCNTVGGIILRLFFTKCGVSFVQSWSGSCGSRCDFKSRRCGANLEDFSFVEDLGWDFRRTLLLQFNQIDLRCICVILLVLLIVYIIMLLMINRWFLNCHFGLMPSLQISLYLSFLLGSHCAIFLLHTIY